MGHERKNSRSNIFIGFLLVGTGVGLLLGHILAGFFIGTGLGFIAQALLEKKPAQQYGMPADDAQPSENNTVPTVAETDLSGRPPQPESQTAANGEKPAGSRNPPTNPDDGPDIEKVWNRIVAYEGETFHQLKGQAFTYRVEGNAIVPSTTKVRIQKSQFAKALVAVPFEKVADVPKDVFGPSYVYAILMDPRIRSDDW